MAEKRTLLDLLKVETVEFCPQWRTDFARGTSRPRVADVGQPIWECALHGELRREGVE